jgi:hypothetical protein
MLRTSRVAVPEVLAIRARKSALPETLYSVCICGIFEALSCRLISFGYARCGRAGPFGSHALDFCYYSYMKLMWHGEEIDLPDIAHEDARKLQELIALNKQDEVESFLTKLRAIDSKDAA